MRDPDVLTAIHRQKVDFWTRYGPHPNVLVMHPDLKEVFLRQVCERMRMLSGSPSDPSAIIRYQDMEIRYEIPRGGLPLEVRYEYHEPHETIR